MATYIPNTPEEIQGMLEAIGVKTIEDLFSELPPEVRLATPLNIPAGVSELEMEKSLRGLADKNKNLIDNVCFLGGGSYDHIIPAAIDHLLLRGDFFTAYTPYQAEISQGTLQSIYEYQSLISTLTGMENSNASLYDGSTAIVEAIGITIGITIAIVPQLVPVAKLIIPHITNTIAGNNLGFILSLKIDIK